MNTISNELYMQLSIEFVKTGTVFFVCNIIIKKFCNLR